MEWFSRKSAPHNGGYNITNFGALKEHSEKIYRSTTVMAIILLYKIIAFCTLKCACSERFTYLYYSYHEWSTETMSHVVGLPQA